MDRELVDRRRAIELVRGGRGGPRDVVDEAIRASWDRCTYLLDSERDQVPVDATDEIAARWDASPIFRAAPQLVEQLAGAGSEAGLLAIVTDAAGQVLWGSAPRDLRRGAESVGLIPGGHWNEPAVCA